MTPGKWLCYTKEEARKGKIRQMGKKPKNRISYDPGIPLQGIYLKKTKTLIRKDACTPMFIAALFTIAKTWKQPKCPSTDKWVKKM